TYSIVGDNPVWEQNPASKTPDINPPTMHLFVWRKNDDLSCNGAFDFYRMFAARMPLVLGEHQIISAKLDPDLWTSCYAHKDAAAFEATLNNLLGAGVVFGGQWFAGHGIYLSNGTAKFTIESFVIK